ncbi:hypothetical protein [Reichenbachiella sp. MSK19-1]|uniref:hypothetical protein n=1 Tax=Reichenbachiella sp. MSK19-1 TaxID=1897631 RepID=UPI000E6D0671|nr:hypothetical protein [Reichenbachiella sp. MSK19-1]
MKTNQPLILLLLLCLSVSTLAQNGDYSIGARSTSLAGASVTITDEWALFNNIGALAEVKNLSVFGTYRNQYGLSELSTIAIGATVPLWNGTLGLGIYRYGGDLLNEQRINLGYSYQLGLVSLGLNMSYFQYYVEDGGTSSQMMIDFGGKAKISEQLYFGAHISNINQAELSTATEELVPTYLKTGLSYRPNESIMLNAEVEKNLDDPVTLRTGLEYQIIKVLALRMGFRTEPFISNFGLGFHIKHLKADYSFGIHPDLGNIHQVSFTYQIRRKE